MTSATKDMSRADFDEALTRYGMRLNPETERTFGTPFVWVTESLSVPLNGSGTTNRRRTLAWLIAQQDRERARGEYLVSLRAIIHEAGTGANGPHYPRIRWHTTAAIERDAEDALVAKLEAKGLRVRRMLFIEEPEPKKRGRR